MSRIDLYPAAAAATGAELVPVWQSGHVRAMSVAQINGGAVTVKNFGANGDGTTDDTAAFTAALAATPTAGGLLFVPAGTYRITGTINVTGANIRIIGAGKQTTILLMDNGSANIIDWTGFDGQLEDMTLAYAGTPDVNAIALNTMSFGGRFRNLTFFNVGCGIKCSGTGRAQSFSQFTVFNYSGSAIWAADTLDVFIGQFLFYAGGGAEGDGTVGQNGAIRITGNVEGFTASQGDVILGRHGLLVSSVTPGRGNCPAFCNFSQVYFDSSATIGCSLTNTILFKFVSCWFAGGRTTGAGAPGCQTFNCTDTTFIGCEFIDNGNHGLILDTGTTGTRVLGCTFDSNGAKVTAGAAYGIAVIGGVTDFLVTGCNFSNGIIPTSAGGGQQGGAINVLPGGSDRYQITGNLMTGNYNAEPIVDGGTGTGKVIRDNAGSAVVAGALKTSAGIAVWGHAAPTSQPTVTGSRGGSAGLASLLTALAATGLIVDGTTA